MLGRINDILHGVMLTAFCTMSVLAFFNARQANKPVRLNVSLGLLMALMALQSLVFIIFSLLCQNRSIVHDSGLSLAINLLIVPLCNLVVMELMRYKHLTVRMMLWQMGVPAVMAATYYTLLLRGSRYLHLSLAVYIAWMSLYSLYYIYHITRVARVYERLVEDVYADTEGRRINWLRRVLLLLLGVTVLFLLLKVFFSSDVSRIAYIPLCLTFWVDLCRHILQMRCVDKVEIGDEDMKTPITQTPQPPKGGDSISVSNVSSPLGDRGVFLSSLRDALLTDRLYANTDLTREIVARAMSTNYKYLTQQLRDATGMTFSAYVNEVRLEESTHMLRDTNMTVEEIFYACGYQTKSTFYRAFTRKYGCTPLEYRRK